MLSEFTSVYSTNSRTRALEKLHFPRWSLGLIRPRVTVAAELNGAHRSRLSTGGGVGGAGCVFEMCSVLHGVHGDRPPPSGPVRCRGLCTGPRSQPIPHRGADSWSSCPPCSSGGRVPSPGHCASPADAPVPAHPARPRLSDSLHATDTLRPQVTTLPSPGTAFPHPLHTPASTVHTSLPSGWDTPRWGPLEGTAFRKGNDHRLCLGSQLRALHRPF